MVSIAPWRITPLFTTTVEGTPIGQGAVTSYGPGRTTHTNAKTLNPWRKKVAAALRGAKFAGGSFDLPLVGPVALELTFTVKKPQSAPKRRRTWPAVRPDLDHYVRAILDAAQTAGVIKDDAQVVHIAAAKTYPGEHPGSMNCPGVRIRVATVTESSELPEGEALLEAFDRIEDDVDDGIPW